MTKQEKLDLALNHCAGPIPFDLGGTSTTGIHISVVEKLREYYGLEKKPVRAQEPKQMLGLVDPDLKEAMGIDTTSVWNPNTNLGIPNIGEKEWRTPWGQTILVPKDFVTTTDETGSVYVYSGGDTNYPPCAKMPANGYFFDALTRGHNYNEDDPHIEDNLEEFQEITQDVLDCIGKRLADAKKTPYARIGAFGGTAVGDVALVPGTVLKEPKGLRDITAWYVALLTNPDYIHQIFTYSTDMALKNLEKVKAVVSDEVQVAFVCGADFGTQKGPLLSKEMFRELYMPYYQKINNWIHKNTKWKTFKHTCGSILPLIPELIESGFDILNPVQWTAEDMDPRTLKREFGKDVVFWGGGVDTQKTFPFGTPEEVRSQVLKMCEIFSENGGFVFATIHNIQALTPVENVVAMADAVREFNGTSRP